MTIKDRRKREYQKRKATIVKAAESILLKEGLKKVTIRNIAKKCELSLGTLYIYFKEKEDIFEAIISKNANRIVSVLEPLYNEKYSGYKQTKIYFKAYLKFCKTNKAYSRIINEFGLLEDSESLAKKCFFQDKLNNKKKKVIKKKNKKKIMNLFIEALRRGKKDGSIRDEIEPIKLTVLVSIITEGMLFMLFKKHHQNILKEQMSWNIDDFINCYFKIVSSYIKR